MTGIILLRLSWLKLGPIIDLWCDHFSSYAKNMPFVYDLFECLYKLNFLKLRGLVDTYLISLAEVTTSIGLYPMLVKYAFCYGFYATNSLANLWLSPYFYMLYFWTPSRPENGALNVFKVGSIFLNLAASMYILMKNMYTMYSIIMIGTRTKNRKTVDIVYL